MKTSLCYSRGNPLQYVIQILNRAKTLKYTSLAELSFKIPIRVKYVNSRSPAEPEDFELQIPIGYPHQHFRPICIVVSSLGHDAWRNMIKSPKGENG